MWNIVKQITKSTHSTDSDIIELQIGNTAIIDYNYNITNIIASHAYQYFTSAGTKLAEKIQRETN